MIFLAITTISQLSFAAGNAALPLNVRNQIETQVREMSALGVPEEALRNMLTQMHRNRFRTENIEQARQEVLACAKTGLPSEPVIHKALEGMTKKVREGQIVAAMATVRNRYTQADRLARTLSNDKTSINAITQAIADCYAAGVKQEDIDAVMSRLTVSIM